MLLEAMTKHEGGRYHDGERFLPWYTGPCLEWLMTLDLLGKYVFEFGCGDSTIWYEKKGAIVLGVESDLEWANKFNENNILHAITESEYYAFIRYSFSLFSLALNFNGFDIVAIDGDYRDGCTEHALACLKPGGYLIVDNWMQPSVEMNWDKTQKLIEGMDQTLYKEPGHYDGWQTLVVRKPL